MVDRGLRLRGGNEPVGNQLGNGTAAGWYVGTEAYCCWERIVVAARGSPVAHVVGAAADGVQVSIELAGLSRRAFGR